MKYKKIKRFIAAVLALTCGFAVFLSSCADTKDENDNAVNNNVEDNTEKNGSDNNNQSGQNDTEVKEIPKPPELPGYYAASTVRDIAPGVVFDEHFRRGINMGNMLEAPEEGEWGVEFKPEFFVMIKERGFDFVRIPIAWHNYLSSSGGKTTIKKYFLSRIKEIVDDALKNDLGVIINIHHFNDMDENPEENQEKLYDIWRIISEQYQNYPATVVFEVFNEPHESLDTKTWNKYQNECVRVIRETNPERKIVVTAGNWGGPTEITDLLLPEDENLILSFHYYDPHNFTHQGAEWNDDMDQYLGTEWLGTDFETRNIDNTFKAVKAWSDAAGLPILLGEFGAYNKADMASRVRWTQFVRESAEYYGFAWSYWEFCSGFGIYDQESEEFFEELANALTGTPTDGNTYATGVGIPKITAERGLGYIGPFTAERSVNILCETWTGMSLYDTEDGTVIIELGGEIPEEWAQAFIILDGLTDTGDGFSHETCELTIRNIDLSISDFCVNLDNNGSLESELLWLSESALQGNSEKVIQNEDGTTTLIFNLESVYSRFKGNGENGFRLKIFIESVPGRGNFDKTGKVEFIKAELK